MKLDTHWLCKNAILTCHRIKLCTVVIWEEYELCLTAYVSLKRKSVNSFLYYVTDGLWMSLFSRVEIELLVTKCKDYARPSTCTHCFWSARHSGLRSYCCGHKKQLQSAATACLICWLLMPVLNEAVVSERLKFASKGGLFKFVCSVCVIVGLMM